MTEVIDSEGDKPFEHRYSSGPKGTLRYTYWHSDQAGSSDGQEDYPTVDGQRLDTSNSSQVQLSGSKYVWDQDHAAGFRNRTSSSH